MKNTSIIFPLFFVFLLFYSCQEDPELSKSLPMDGVSLNSLNGSTYPTLDSVVTYGTEVILYFTNHNAPNQPEGGFELVLNGARTYENITPRVSATDSNGKGRMRFFLNEPLGTHYFKVYARWNSGYHYSNEMSGVTTNQAITDPTLEDVIVDGLNVKLAFTNHAAPNGPEGGYELMLNGARTYENITPRLYSSAEKDTMEFTLTSPGNYCFQVYARWNSGYKYTDQICKEVGGISSNANDLPSGLPALQLLRGYEFEDNIGRNVTVAQDGIQVHSLARDGGIVRSVDGGARGMVGAYHFKIMDDSATYTGSGKWYRQELMPRDLPEPYFRQQRHAKWGQVYVYQMRVKLTQNYGIGSEYVAIMSSKNDSQTSRNGSVSIRTEGDHYTLRQNYATAPNVGGDGETTGPYADWRRRRYASDGQRIYPDVDFSSTNYMALSGKNYAKINNDIEKWVVWTWYIKWSYGTDGFVKIYKDNQLIHNYTGGPNSFNDPDAPYVKFGIYNAFWKNGHHGYPNSNMHESYVDYFRVYVPQ